MISASSSKVQPNRRQRRTESRQLSDTVQKVVTAVSDLDTPQQQSIANEVLAPVVEQLKQRLADEDAKTANDRLYGPFLTTERTMLQLNLKNRQALNGRLARNTILRVKTADGRNAYPSLQFESDQILPALMPVLKTLLPHAATEWTVLDWLVHPHPDLDDDRPIDRLRTDEAEAVMIAAREDASAWAA